MGFTKKKKKSRFWWVQVGPREWIGLAVLLEAATLHMLVMARQQSEPPSRYHQVPVSLWNAPGPCKAPYYCYYSCYYCYSLFLLPLV